MGCSSGPDIIQDGLVFCLDAASIRCYDGSSSTCLDLKGKETGTFQNGATFSEENGGTFVFDGTDDWISTNYDCITGQNPRTVSIWYKSDLTQNKNLLGWGSASNHQLWDVLLYQGKVGVHLYVSGSEAGATYTNNVWQNIVFTYTHPTIKSYMGGVYQASYTNSIINTGSTTDLGIAYGGYSSGYRYFNGNISNVSIYNRALSADEIRQNYLSTKERFV